MQFHSLYWNATLIPLRWRHNERDDVSSHQSLDYLLNRLFRRRSKKSPKGPGLCEGNSPVTGEFPAQRASNAENVSIWWRHHTPNITFLWCSVYLTNCDIMILCAFPREKDLLIILNNIFCTAVARNVLICFVLVEWQVINSLYVVITWLDFVVLHRDCSQRT